MLFDPEDPTSCTRGSRDSKPPAGQGLSFIAVECESANGRLGSTEAGVGRRGVAHEDAVGRISRPPAVPGYECHACSQASRGPGAVEDVAGFVVLSG